MGKIVKGIIIGAVIGLTGGLALPLLGVTTVLGAAVTLKGAALFGAIYGGLQGAAMQFAKKPNMDMGAAQARLNLNTDPQADGKWVFGETPAALDIVHQEQISDDVIAYVIACAAHEIDSFGDFYIEDELISFVGSAAQGDWLNALFRQERLGTDSQGAIVIAGSTQWGVNARGRGIAHISLRFDFSADSKKLEAGIPNRITQIVKGSKVYDPRLDSTRGGSGSHRADDQSTWEWSDNWALIVAHYLLGYRQQGQIVYGVGVNPDDVDWDQVIAMANVCDETVDGKARYKVGGVFPTTQDHQAVVSQLEAAIGGKVSKVGGKYYIWCPHDDLVPLNTITDAQVIREVGVNFQPAGPLRDLFNTARGRYIEPSAIWQPVPYPTVTELTAVTEDGRERLMDRDFSIIQDRSIAERVAREMVRRSRFSATWTLAVGPAGLLYQPFTVVNLNLPETDNQNVLARVIDMEFTPDGIVALTLIEEDASIYDTTLPLGTAFVNDIPASYDPTQAFDVDNLAAAPISVSGSGGTVSDAFQVTWDNPGRFVRDTEVRYRIKGDIDFSYVQATRITSAVIVPVEPNTLYEIEARHISISNVAGPYSAIEQTSGNTSRSLAVSGSVEYDPTNSWTYDPVEESVTPTQTTADAVFTFTRGGSIIATRTVRATINTATGNITVNVNHASTGEATVGAVSFDNSRSVAVRVTHSGSGLRVTGQFLSIEVESVDLQPIIDDLEDLQDEIDNLNDVILPGLQQDLADLDSSLNTLNNTTLPALQQDLNDLDAKFPIQSVDIGDDQITAPKIFAGAVIAGKIAANAIAANEIAGNTITGNMIKADTITAFNIAADTITANEIATGAVTANKISVGNLAAINARTGRLTSDIIQTAPAGQRLELTAPEQDATYAIWVGDGSGGAFGAISGASQTNPVIITSTAHGRSTGQQVGIRGVAGMTEINGKVYTITVINANQFSLNGEDGSGHSAYTSGGAWQLYAKSDAAGVFWVKHNGQAKIDGGTFNIGTRGKTNSASNTALAGQSANTLTVDSGDFNSNGNAVVISGDASYFGAKTTSGTCQVEYPAPPSDTSGNLRVQRSTDGGSNWANVGNLIPFFAAVTTQTFGASPDPITCFASANLDRAFTIIDETPPTGTVRYRIIYNSFSSFFTTAQTVTNRLEITALQG